MNALYKISLVRKLTNELTIRKTYFKTLGQEFNTKNFPSYWKLYYLNESKLDKEQKSIFKYFKISYFLVIILIFLNIFNNLVLFINKKYSIEHFILSIIFGFINNYINVLVYKEGFLIVYWKKFKKLYKIYEIILLFFLILYLFAGGCGFNGYFKFFKLIYGDNKKYFEIILILIELLIIKSIMSLKVISYLRVK